MLMNLSYHQGDSTTPISTWLHWGCFFKVSPSFNLNSQSKNSLSAYVLGLKLNKQLQLVMFERIGPICWEERIFGIVTLANLL